jgi:DNA-directed RNA polymerase subunit RPC12/RpoP
MTAEAHLCPECGELFPRGCMVLDDDRRVVCLYCAIRIGLKGGIPTPETERGRLKLAYTTPKTREPKRDSDGLLAKTPRENTVSQTRPKSRVSNP